MEDDNIRALRSEWEAGQVPEHALCKKYGVTTTALRRMIIKEGWSKRHPPTEEKVQNLVHLFSFDPNEQAALSAAQVISLHRKDVARLRSISSTLVDRLGILLSGKPLLDQDGNPMMCMGSRESPADLLEKLSRVMVRTTEIERQAFGLKTFNPETAATDAELQKELDDLTSQVEAIARDKAAT